MRRSMPLANRYFKTGALCFCLALIICTKASGQGQSLVEFEPILSEEFKVLLRAATPAQGESIFMRKCSACHDHGKLGGHGKGPHLWNWLGRKAGSIKGFDFSSAMSGSGHSWNLANLNYYLTNTERAVPGRSMDFRGIKKDRDRARLLAFMITLNDNPPPLP